MPLAKPNKDERQKEFIVRCMIDPTMKTEYKNKSQRLAVCYQQWKNK
jgi:hypothetical protein